MLGRAHTLSGAAAWLALSPWVADHTGWFTLTPATWAVGAVVCAGAALAPDLDHPGNSSASNALKPVTTTLSHAVETISFGHRQGTHSLLGVGFFAGLALIAAGPTAPLGAAIVAFFLTAFTVKALQIPHAITKSGKPALATAVTVLLAAAGAAGTVLVADGSFGWFAAAAISGFAIHILGDAITMAGVPLLWPLGKDFRLAALKAGGHTELWVLTPVFLAVIGYAAVTGVWHQSVLGAPVATGTSQVEPAVPRDNAATGKPDKPAKPAKATKPAKAKQAKK